MEFIDNVAFNFLREGNRGAQGFEIDSICSIAVTANNEAFLAIPEESNEINRWD